MERSRQRGNAAVKRQPVTFRLAPDDRAAVERICEAQLFLSPAQFYETAVKLLIDRYATVAYRGESEADDAA